jgi:hypothetical protein
MTSRAWKFDPSAEASITHHLHCEVCGEVVAHLKVWPESNVDVFMVDEVIRPRFYHAACAPVVSPGTAST